MELRYIKISILKKKFRGLAFRLFLVFKKLAVSADIIAYRHNRVNCNGKRKDKPSERHQRVSLRITLPHQERGKPANKSYNANGNNF